MLIIEHAHNLISHAYVGLGISLTPAPPLSCSWPTQLDQAELTAFTCLLSPIASAKLKLSQLFECGGIYGIEWRLAKSKLFNELERGDTHGMTYMRQTYYKHHRRRRLTSTGLAQACPKWMNFLCVVFVCGFYLCDLLRPVSYTDRVIHAIPNKTWRFPWPRNIFLWALMAHHTLWGSCSGLGSGTGCVQPSVIDFHTCLVIYAHMQQMEFQARPMWDYSG